jgi:zinc transport system substrate-binding protein
MTQLLRRRKNMKKIISLIFLATVIFSLTGCLKRDNLEDIDIYTTAYPIEYITQRLYGEHSNIYSIYPDGVIIDDYSLTDKQIKDYSKASMFIFNGLSKEKDYVVPMFNYNKNIKIIDTTLTLGYTNEIDELWMDPSNALMLAQNICTGFKEYINNHYLKNEIDANYEQIKIDMSNLDAKLKLMIESASNKTIVVSNDLFKFLEKYDFTVISLEENDNLTDKVVEDVKQMIKNKQISYIFLKQNEEVNNTIKKIQAETNVELVHLHSLANISENERNANKDYISLMNENMELLKNELYD